MKTSLLLTVLFAGFSLSFPTWAVVKSSKACAKDAIERGEALLRFHNDYKPGEPLVNHVPPVAADIKALPREKAFGGRGKLQVLEVPEGIYKAEYTVVLKYAEIKDTNNPAGLACILMSEAIREEASPF